MSDKLDPGFLEIIKKRLQELNGRLVKEMAKLEAKGRYLEPNIHEC